MHIYAQIDEAGYCVGVSHLAAEIDMPHLIPLSPDDDVQPGDILQDGMWVRPEPEPPSPPDPTPEQQRIEQLETDLGNVLFESAVDKARLAELEVIQGDMLLEIALLKAGGAV